jgi:hypothetical protein
VVVVDTNVLIYAADSSSPLHAACLRWLETRRGGADAWFMTWSIVYEFLRVGTHPRVMRRPWIAAQAWQFVSALIASPGLSILTATDRHADVASQVIAEIPHLSGNLLHDTHTAVLMREHGIRQICTRDTDFHRFPFLEVIDPVGTA